MTLNLVVGEEGIVSRTINAKFATEVATIKEQVELNKDPLSDEYFGTINDFLSTNSAYNEKFCIQENKLVYDATKVTNEEKNLLEGMGIKEKQEFYVVEFDFGKGQKQLKQHIVSGNLVQAPEVKDTYFQGWYYLAESGSASNPTYTETQFNAENTTITKDYFIYAKYYNEAVIMARNTNKSFWQSKYKPYITSITFTSKSNLVPSTYVEVENISQNSQAAPIMAYIVDTSTEEETKYEVIVYSPNTIYDNPNSRYYFESFSNVININFENFNTSKTVDMTNIFYNCFKIENLYLSNFDTSNVKDMSDMFYRCKGITELDLSNFDTKNVKTFYEMFRGCSNLATIYVSKKWKTEGATTSQMFDSCKAKKVTLKEN